MLLVQLFYKWHTAAHQKSIGHLWMVCPVRFPKNLSMVGYMLWSGIGPGRVYALIETLVLSRKRDASSTVVVDRLYSSRDVVHALPYADWCNLVDAVTYMPPCSRAGTEATDPPPVPLGVVDEYNGG